MSTGSAATRYALYFAPPPESALWRFGSSVLGYDARTGETVRQTVPDGWSAAQWHEATAEPRRYGFHATLKAPFRLAEGTSEAALVQAVAQFCASRPAVPVPGFEVKCIGAFVALVPAGGLDGLARLEADLVPAFERFRAPLTEDERVRRNPEALTPRQRQALERWGYPFVLDDFRFHMTLTGRLPPDRIGETVDALSASAAACGATGPVPVDPILVFRQPAGEERFTVLPPRRPSP